MTSEFIEFARLKRDHADPRSPGTPMPAYPASEIGAWQGIHVAPVIAGVCRELSRRGRHGVYVDAIGGPDMLAELDLLGLPYKVVSFARRGKWNDTDWVIPDALFRFAEDAADVTS